MNRQNKILLLMAVAFFILYSAPQFVRFAVYDNTMIGTTPYYHVRAAEMLSQNDFYDELSYGGRYYTYPPLFHLMLMVFSGLKYFIVPFFGAAGIVLCYHLSRTLGFEHKEAIISSALLGLIPGYVYLSSHINPRLPALIFLVASYYFFLKSEENKNYRYFTIITLILSALTHTLVALAGMVFAIIIFRGRRKELGKLLAASSAASLLIWYVPTIMMHGMTSLGLSFYEVFIELRSGVQYFIFESGVVSDSVGLVTFFFAIYAMFRYRGKHISFLRDWFFLSIIVSLVIGNRMNEHMLFPIAILVGKLIANWEEVCEKLYLLNIHKNPNFWLAIFAVYTVLVGVLAAGSLVFFPPSPSEYGSMKWLSENTPEDAVVMAYWHDGHWITAIGERKNVIDAYAEFAPDVDGRYEDMLTVMEGSDVEKSVAAMKKYNVSYVYYSIINDQYCTGFAYQSRYPYFELVYKQDRDFIFKVNYEGTANATDICQFF